MSAYLSDAELMQQTAWETRTLGGAAADFAHGTEDNGKRKAPGYLDVGGGLANHSPSERDSERSG